MKVYPFKIPKPKDAQLIVQIDKEPIFYSRLHSHEEIQVSLIVNGHGKLLVGDSIHQFEKGDIIVIGSHLPHLFKSIPDSNDAHMITIFFTEVTFGKGFFQMPDLKEVQNFFNLATNGFKVEKDKKKITPLFFSITEETKIARFITFLKLIKALTNSKKTTLTKFISPKELTSNEGQRLQVIFDHIFHNFHKNIQLKEISSMAFMTPTAFCRFFKQRTNKTFFQFLIELRVAHACQLLITKTDINVNEVSDLCGFNSISNFNRKFKQIKKITPTAFRKTYNSSA